MRKLITAAVVVGVLTVGGAGAAFAGEVTGRGNPTPVSDVGGFRAGSICAFSGLDDGSESGLGVQPGVTQNWGQIAKSFGWVQLTPTSVLINKRGEIVKRYVGEPDFASLHTLVEKLLAET